MTNKNEKEVLDNNLDNVSGGTKEEPETLIRRINIPPNVKPEQIVIDPKYVIPEIKERK